MTCRGNGCARPTHARGLCGTHYHRWRRLGTAELTPYVTPPCAIEECVRVSYANGFCSLHYNRLARTGSLELPPRPALGDRLAGYAVAANGCWIWNGAPGPNGYCRISIDNRSTYAHRTSYEFHVGPIPAGLTIDHLCRERTCVNPNHLEPVTLAENSRRAAAARRAAA